MVPGIGDDGWAFHRFGFAQHKAKKGFLDRHDRQQHHESEAGRTLLRLKYLANGLECDSSRGEQQKEGILGAGLALGVLKLVATMLKPTITQYVAKKMSGYAAGAGPRRRA